MWEKAKRLMPPWGTQLLSKYNESFPYSYSRAKGCEIDGLIDMSTMGIGCCILGYADSYVNKAVKDSIDLGSMSSLNCEEDVELAELLLKKYPSFDCVRYARTGGESVQIALRIAQTYAKEEEFEYNGYHGWYISDPRERDRKALDLTKKIVIIDPYYLSDKELAEIKIQCEEKDIILIYDMITLGLRRELTTFPDLMVFGKAISNGYPMGVILGKREVMEASKDTFISSTYWTERIGPTAAIATLEKMEALNAIKYVNRLGLTLKKGLIRLGIAVSGYPFLLHVEFDDLEFITKEMLKRGYLTGNRIYLSYAHSDEIIEQYLEDLEEII